MGNFDFLRGKEDYAAFAPAAIEAETRKDKNFIFPRIK